MSNYALSCENQDKRYTYCLEKLYAKTGKKLDYELIERPELEEVQDFDAFYDDYKKVITSIMDTMEEGDTLYLNASSGTPPFAGCARKNGSKLLPSAGRGTLTHG